MPSARNLRALAPPTECETKLNKAVEGSDKAMAPVGKVIGDPSGAADPKAGSEHKT